MQQIKRLKSKVEKYERLKSRYEDTVALVDLAIEEDDDTLLDEITIEFNGLTDELSNMKLETLLSGKYDKNNAIISLHPGAGGTEAQDWALMLYRMYQRWAERRGFDVEVLDYLPGDEAGLKSVTILVKGDNAYG